MDKVFESIGIQIMKLKIPPFEIYKGELVKIYVPNFYETGERLGDLFISELKKFLSGKEVNFKAYCPMLFTKGIILNKINRIFSVLTIYKYIAQNTNLSKTEIERLCVSLKLESDRKVKDLILAQEKILELAVAFNKSDFLFFDYYGIGVEDYKIMTEMINVEIAKGKSAIGIDRLEFIEQTELHQNIKRIIAKEK